MATDQQLMALYEELGYNVEYEPGNPHGASWWQDVVADMRRIGEASLREAAEILCQWCIPEDEAEDVARDLRARMAEME